MTNEAWAHGVDRGWTRSLRQRERARRPKLFTLSEWLPAAIRARGGDVSRDDERLYRDLQVARDAREDGR